MSYSNSTSLFAMPGFFRGVARVLDLGATFDVYNESPSPDVADKRALASDWAQVGKDLAEAMAMYERAEQA